MKLRNACMKYGRKVVHKANATQLAVGTALMTGATQVLAALPTEVDTAITTAQTDALAMIGKGFAYLGAIGAALVALGVFWKILRKPGR